MPGSFLRRIIPARTSTGLLLTACSVLLGTAAARPVVASDDAAVTPRPPVAAVPDSLRGTSRQLRARFISPTDGAGLQLVEERFGLAAARTPGVYAVPDSAGRPGFAYIVMRDFRAKTGARVGDYRVGYWPEERGRGRPSYEMPAGFIEVTEDNQDTFVSANFRLRDFLTRNQEDVWPKYLVLDERLLDKLELVTTELRRSGYVSHRLAVLSGFRTPDHNRTVRSAGASGDSRHQYGDAADVIVDGNADGRMDDLNRDGRVNARDLALFLGAVERVEALHPDLVGGLGTYRSTRTTSGYLHIDVRGTRVRWGT